MYLFYREIITQNHRCSVKYVAQKQSVTAVETMETQQVVKSVQWCSGVFILSFEKISHICDVSIVDLEQVNTG